jgi:hypothetical protein
MVLGWECCYSCSWGWLVLASAIAEAITLGAGVAAEPTKSKLGYYSQAVRTAAIHYVNCRIFETP